MSKLENVTIIIPTNNPRNYTIRSMKYWSGKGPNIIYLDGSESPIAKKYRNFFLKNINHIHLPISYIKRIS